MAVPNYLQAELVNDARSVLGEGPVWEAKTGFLYWVDIEGCRLHRHHPESDTNKSWDFDGMISAIIPEVGGSLLVAHEKGMMRFYPESGKQVSLPLLVNSDPRLRFNDGKCDPLGSIFIGTMDKELVPHAGQLYRISAQARVQILIPGTSVSNGMAWTSDRRYFYYIDSPTFEVWRFDYDADTGDIAIKTVAFRIPKKYGSADGMTIDAEGMLWIAHWGGHAVRRWDPDTGTVLATVHVDAPHVTCCCFGGRKMDTLYITTARSGLDPETLDAYPASGGLFKCQPGKTGFAPNYFNANA